MFFDAACIYLGGFLLVFECVSHAATEGERPGEVSVEFLQASSFRGILEFFSLSLDVAVNTKINFKASLLFPFS